MNQLFFYRKMSGLPRSYTNHFQQKWYYRLVPGSEGRALMSDYPLETLRESIIVCWTPKLHENNPVRMYSKFNSVVEFYRYQQRTEPNAFYEIILGEYPQKPHFDLDLKGVSLDEANAIVDRLILAIRVILERFQVHWIPETDLLIYTSHGFEKHSFHIVLNNHSHANNVEAKAFYQLVIAEMPEPDRQFIDPAVYSPRQQFRILGSSKLGVHRPKIFAMPWGSIEHRYLEEPETPELRKLMDFEESLVSCTHTCRLLPSFLPEQTRESNLIPREFDDITEEIAKAAINLLKSKSPNAWPYRPLGIRGGMILLKRVQPSMCRTCNRVHQMENPFMTVVKKETEFVVYFNCRRSRNSWIVGSIPIPGVQKVDSISQSWIQDVIGRVIDISKESRGQTFKSSD